MAKRPGSIPQDNVIENCEPQFAFRCPQLWQALTATADANVRHCGTCEKNVYLCGTRKELKQRVKQGECVAFPFSMDSYAVGFMEELPYASDDPPHDHAEKIVAKRAK